MSRMKLYKNTRLGETEIYPIYELTYSELTALTGFNLDDSNDQVGTDVNKYRRWHVSNNEVYKGIDGNIPRQENQPGNIIPFWHRYRNVINGNYYLEPDVLSSFAAIEQAVRPDDWGTNPNYITMGVRTSGVPSDHSVSIPTCVNIRSSFDSSTSYYEDTKRTQLRMFFNEKGNSFSVCKASYYNYDRWTPITYGVAMFPVWFSATQNEPQYSFTSSQGNVFDTHYYLEYGDSGWDYNWNYWNGATNCQMIFVHYVENGTTDFYGIALIQMNNMTETAEPVGIKVIAWDAAWWEGSIISGGGGSGQWTHDGPTSYVQGGQGRFSAPSDNRGNDPQDAHNIVDSYVDRFNSNIAPLYGGYNQYLVSKANWAPMTEMMGKLWDPSLLDSWNNSMMNPLTSIITCHFMPERLAPVSNGTTSVIKVLDRALSNTQTPKYTNPIRHEIIGEVDINSYFEGFPDYEDTNVYIYLPYIGTYQLDTEAVMEGQLAVDYTADSYTGDCLAWIWTKDRFGNSQLRYTFKGNCAKPMYLASIVGAGAQRIGIIAQTAVNVGSQAIANKMMSNQLSKYWQPFENEEGTTTWRRSDSVNPLAPIITGQAIGSGINSLLNAGAKATQGNASTGIISVPVDTQCYLIITRPQWSAPDEYGKQFGYPSDIGGTINQSDTEAGDPFTNFLSIRSIRLDGLAATDDEKAEIEALMVAGVFVS